MEMKRLGLPLASHVTPDFPDYSPTLPDDFTKFVWYAAKNVDATKPYGD